MSEGLDIGGVRIAPRTRQTINLPVARLYTHTEMTMPVHVVRGGREGPRLFVSAAIHGDELNGVEIVRRLAALKLQRLRGTLVLVPVVNVFGFTHRIRYLPDRRDLNRFFPGNGSGSLASRLAHLFMEEIVTRCTHGIDLHTGAAYRTNLPQIRADLGDAETLELARAFGAPVLVDATVRDGSLRQAVRDRGLPMLVYEAGEALRLDEAAIRLGVRGVVSVMRALGMLPKRPRRSSFSPLLVSSCRWVRAPESGLLRTLQPLGSQVRRGDALGLISGPLGEDEVEVTAPEAGIIIGQTTQPLVYEGEALFHLASSDRTLDAARVLDQLEQAWTEESSWLDVDADLD